VSIEHQTLATNVNVQSPGEFEFYLTVFEIIL
jgi:hypothetical protein